MSDILPAGKDLTVNHYRKALVALVPFVSSCVAYFLGADSDVAFVWAAAITALTAAGVYAVPNEV